MGKIAFSQNLAKLKSFGSRGDVESAVVSAMLDNIRVMAFTQDTEGDEGANIIRISAQLQDMDGSPIASVNNILVKSVPIIGAGTMTIGTNGTLVAGSASTEAWVRTDATGALDIDVLNATAEDNLVQFQLDDGVVEILVLTFA